MDQVVLTLSCHVSPKMPYFADHTSTKNRQRDRFMRLVMAVVIPYSICVYFDDPDSQCTEYFSLNKRFLRHIRRYSLSVFAVNNEPKDGFLQKVFRVSEYTIMPAPMEFAEFLNAYVLPDEQISVLWYDHCGTPNPAYLKKKEGKETMQDLLHRLVRDNVFAARATVMMNYNTRLIGGRVQSKFDRFILRSIANSSYFMVRYPSCMKYRGKAYESGIASGAGQMIFQTMVLKLRR